MDRYLSNIASTTCLSSTSQENVVVNVDSAAASQASVQPTSASSSSSSIPSSSSSASSVNTDSASSSSTAQPSVKTAKDTRKDVENLVGGKIIFPNKGRRWNAEKTNAVRDRIYFVIRTMIFALANYILRPVLRPILRSLRYPVPTYIPDFTEFYEAERAQITLIPKIWGSEVACVLGHTRHDVPYSSIIQYLIVSHLDFVKIKNVMPIQAVELLEELGIKGAQEEAIRLLNTNADDVTVITKSIVNTYVNFTHRYVNLDLKIQRLQKALDNNKLPFDLSVSRRKITALAAEATGEEGQQLETYVDSLLRTRHIKQIADLELLKDELMVEKEATMVRLFKELSNYFSEGSIPIHTSHHRSILDMYIMY